MAQQHLPVMRGGPRQKIKDDYKDAELLMRIFSWRRPHMSEAEQEFVARYLDAIGCEHDDLGNRFLRIPGDDATLWSCHTDTVHHDGGYQRLAIAIDSKSDYHIGVQRGEGNCLGGDDGTGVWLMLKMIEAKKPGLYVFHRGEEKGCIGSRWIKDKNPSFLTGIERAIAFDRRDYDNIITHQGSERGCSQSFANALGDQLALGYKADPTGAFTDTRQYFSLVPECTNISVGYSGAHGPTETQNISHALRLLDRVLQIDTSKLPTIRDPKVVESRYSSGYGGSYYQGRNYYADAVEGSENEPHNTLAHPHRRFGQSQIYLPGRSLNNTGRSTNYGSSIKAAEQEEIVNDMGLDMAELMTKYPEEVIKLLHKRNITEEDVLFEVHGNKLHEFY